MDAKKWERPFDEEEVLQELKKIWIGINCQGQMVLLLPFFKNVGGGKRGYYEGFQNFYENCYDNRKITLMNGILSWGLSLPA